MTKKETLTKVAWIRGQLRYKLKPYQLPVYDNVWNVIAQRFGTYVVNCCRRRGKTFTCILIAIEYGIRNPGSQIKYGIPIGKNYIDMIMPSVNTILADMPAPAKGEKPIVEHKSSEKRLIINNGSVIKFAGTDDDDGQGLRGDTSHLNFLDEAGFMANLSQVYESVLFPQTLTTGGSTIFISTPSDSADSDYETIYREHKEDNRLAEFTIYDGGFNEEQIEACLKEMKGAASTRFRREMLCEFVTESDMAIISEWQEGFVKQHELIRLAPRDEFFNYYHRYIAMDTGVKDLTAVLFAYYDYQASKLFIEDELIMNGPEMTTEKLAAEIKAKKQMLWQEQTVYKHIADSNNLHLIQDMSLSYGLPFNGVTKNRLLTVPNESVEPGMINKLKVFVGQGRLVVNPKCEQLIGCLYNGIWAKNQRGAKFAHSKKFGHYDALAALVYLVLSIDTNTNPIPVLHGTNRENFGMSPYLDTSTSTQKSWGKLIPLRTK